MKNELRVMIQVRLLTFLAIVLQVGFIGASFDALTSNRGGSRVFEVMYKGPGGIADINRKTRFAETKNLGFDLNLTEISARFGCATKMGQVFIAYALAKPVSPLDTSSTIKNRQSLIQLLVGHPELQAKLEELLQEAVEHEAVVMKFMEKRPVLKESEINSFGDCIGFVQGLMDKSLLWQSLNLWINGTTTVSGTLYGVNSVYKGIVNTYAYGSALLDNDENVSLSGDVKAGLFGLGTGVLDTILVTLKLKEESPTFITSTYKVLMFAIATKALYENYMRALDIRNSLYSLNRLIKIAQQIEGICNEYGVGHQFKLSSIRSVEGEKLLNDLQHSRYNEKDSMLILTPAVHTFLYDVHEYDINFAPIYASIAEMDAYIAIAKKMKALQNEDHKLSFTQFIDSSKPMIHAQGFWNMLVSVGDVVTNNISEGRNIILTGSNEGGKTTAIRAILQNIVLAQTFGIAAASQFSLTQFDVINSYLNVSDDILNGKSRFASELQQAKDILQRIQALQPTEKFFFAFDELFTGTNGEDGAETAYRFIDNIASYKGIQFIYATHFNKLKTIGANNPACANYKIEPPLRNAQGKFIRDDKGQLIYPYKLSPGANDVNVAMDRARDAGIFA